MKYAAMNYNVLNTPCDGNGLTNAYRPKKEKKYILLILMLDEVTRVLVIQL